MEQHRVKVGPVDIYYQVVGCGEPVVLVHGLSGSTRWWAKNIPFLSCRYRLFIVDLIGFGESRGHRFVLEEAADHLVAWMDRLGLERASLVGHSMGGFIAADLAASFPERVDRLVLVCAAALPLGRKYIRNAIGLARAVGYLSLSFLPILFMDALRAGPVNILKASRELLSADIQSKLPRIQAPTLVVWGAKDALVPLAVGERLVGSLPDAALVVIEEAGHVPMWDTPDRFNEVVGGFLAARVSTHSLEPDSGYGK